MRSYSITDRRQFQDLDGLVECVRRNAERGVEMVQVREKDLTARELARLVERVLAVCGGMRVLVNGRVDVALACGAHGAHLPAGAPAPASWRGIAPEGFLFGVSCHTVEELRAAEEGGADFAVYGPVYKPLSKTDERVPVGVEGLRAAAASVRLPVFALGGVTWENAEECLRAGAAGVAGITLFQRI